MTNRVDKFKKYFIRLEECLKSRYFKGDYNNYKRMIDELVKSVPIIKEYSSDLYSLGYLRNAIVHSDSSSYYAIPTEATLKKIEVILDKLTNPKIIDKYTSIPLVANENDVLYEVMDKMISNDFSQIPLIINNQFYKMITLENISKILWSNDDIDSIKRAKVTDENVNSIFDDNYSRMSKNSYVIDIIKQFDNIERNGKPIMAILIYDPENCDQVIGIITQHDIHRLYKEIKI